MRLLVCAQTVDRADPILGFFHNWLGELSTHFGHIEVVCLREGKHDLPKNISIHTLGSGRLHRAAALLSYSLKQHKQYDAVFVHMSEEFVLVSGSLWRLLGKRVYLWRNHYQGSIMTDIAAFFCTKVFCTSKYSYTAKYKKTSLMPVGIDLELFKPVPGAVRARGSVLFLGRLTPSKRPELLLEALGSTGDARATFCGPSDKAYLEHLKKRAQELGVSDRVRFIPAVHNEETPRLYSEHEVFVNCSPSGMLDKTIYEAAACQCLVLASSRDWAALLGKEPIEDSTTLAAALTKALSLSPEQRAVRQSKQAGLVAKHSLKVLGARLKEEITP